MEKSPSRTTAEKLAAFQFPLHPTRTRTVSDGEKSGKSGKSPDPADLLNWKDHFQITSFDCVKSFEGKSFSG